jgi:cytochrome P450
VSVTVGTNASTPNAIDNVTRLFRLDPDALRCPYPLFDAVREESPVVFVEAIECFLVTRHADICEVARNPQLFSSVMPTGPVLARQQAASIAALLADEPELAQKLRGLRGTTRVLLSADPPDHSRQRKLVNRAFTPPKVKALEPRIDEVANNLIDDFAHRGAVELVHEFAVLLPLTIIAECLGVGDHDLPVFKKWSDDFVAAIGNHNMNQDQLRSLLLSQNEFFVYFQDKINERRAEPRPDLISDVIEARLDGEPLGDNEMLAMFNQFLVAGNETTTKLIAASARTLAERPELQQRLRDNPSLIAGFVEEMLRLEAPVQGLYRTAVEEAVVGGVPIPAGSHLMLVYAAGNRDARRFPDPETPDPERENAMRHLAFGHGEHFCIGAALARAEGRIAVETMLSRLDRIALAPGNRFDFEPSYVLHGLKELHLTFTPTRS